jgi:hypothetical protein
MKYLRGLAILLFIWWSPVLVAAYFVSTLEHFNKAMCYVPSFAFLALGVIMVRYGFAKYVDDYDPTLGLTFTADPNDLYYFAKVGIMLALFSVGVLFSPHPL